MQQGSEQDFVIELLRTLQRDSFSLRGWRRFFWRSWYQSCQTARAHPTLLRSWQHVTGFVTLLALAMLAGNSLWAGWTDTLRLLPGFVFCLAWQQSDLYWHLGLNRSAQSGQLLPRLGLANTLTWLRGLGASYLLGRLIGGLTTPPPVALIVFLGGIATDILDGYIARYTATQSKLGQIADGEADFCLYLSLTIILFQHGMLPLWVALVMLLRFIIPLLAALLSYLALAQPVSFGSTLWGKCAGLAQCLYFLVLLAPPALAPYMSVLSAPLLCMTIVLLVVAPLAQIMTNVRHFNFF